MTYPGRVRIANNTDEEEVMELCRQLHRENGLFKMDEEKVRVMLRRAFNREGGILGVIGEPGKIEGMIYMLVSTFWYSDEPHLEEILAFVREPYRKTKNAIELMDFARWCSDQTGFKLIIGVISNERTAGKVRLYQRKFHAPVGTFFLYKGRMDDSAKVA